MLSENLPVVAVTTTTTPLLATRHVEWIPLVYPSIPGAPFRSLAAIDSIRSLISRPVSG